MKKFVYLVIAPALFSMASCDNNMPRRKAGQFCNVMFTSEVATSDCPTFAPMDRDLEIHLNIPYETTQGAGWDIEPTKEREGILTNPNVEYTVNVDDIHVVIAGKEYPDAFTYFQQSDGYNTLTIRKEYMVNDLTINVIPRPRAYLYLFGYELGEELDDRRVDNPKTHEEDPKYTHDLIVTFSRAYQNIKKPIKTLSGQEAYPVFEHDSIDVTFTLVAPTTEPEKQKPLPDDLRYRCNARYTLEGTDYTRTYSEPYSYKEGDKDPVIGYRQCTFHVPYIIVNDHGSFRQFGTE